MSSQTDSEILDKPVSLESSSEEILEQPPQEPTPLPLAPLFVLCCIVVSESFSITMIFPFLADMVKDFGIAKTDEDIGFYAGWIASAFNIAQFASSFAWGRISDHFGRRPVLLLGLSGNFLMIFMFGWSSEFWYAILARAANGFLNGNIGVAKTYLAEITDNTNAAKGFSVFGFVWGLGLILGPSIGGYLSNPHRIAPDIFPVGSLLHQYPYLLPCLVSSSVTLIGFIVGFFFLPETLPNTACSCQPETAEEAPLRGKKNVKQTLKEMNEEWIFIQFLKSREVMATSAIYSILAFHTMIFDEVFSIWSPYGKAQGGIEFSSIDIGTSYVIGGVVLLISQVFFFPFVNQWLGPLRLYQISVLMLSIVLPFFPVSGLLVEEERWKVWLVIGALTIVRTCFNNFAFTTSMMMVNNSAIPSKLGAANGFAQTFCSGLRSFAPSIGGSLLAWSLTNGIGFPMNQYLSFFFMGFCAFITFLLCFLLDPTSINSRKLPELDEEETDEEALSSLNKVDRIKNVDNMH